MLSPEAITTHDRDEPVDEIDVAADFDTVYRDHAAFVWRSARRLGIPPSIADDVTQEVFVTVHRRLGDYRPGSSMRSWLYGITRGVAANARRSLARRRTLPAAELPDAPDSERRRPHAETERAEAVRILYALLEQLDDDKREAFVLAELEQLPAPEIAEALGLNVNTTYSRIRAARRQFKEAVARHRAAEGRKS